MTLNLINKHYVKQFSLQGTLLCCFARILFCVFQMRFQSYPIELRFIRTCRGLFDFILNNTMFEQVSKPGAMDKN